jgi:hypothetical protein
MPRLFLACFAFSFSPYLRFAHLLAIEEEGWSWANEIVTWRKGRKRRRGSVCSGTSDMPVRLQQRPGGEGFSYSRCGNSRRPISGASSSITAFLLRLRSLMHPDPFFCIYAFLITIKITDLLSLTGMATTGGLSASPSIFWEGQGSFYPFTVLPLPTTPAYQLHLYESTCHRE